MFLCEGHIDNKSLYNALYYICFKKYHKSFTIVLFYTPVTVA